MEAATRLASPSPEPCGIAYSKALLQCAQLIKHSRVCPSFLLLASPSAMAGQEVIAPSAVIRMRAWRTKGTHPESCSCRPGDETRDLEPGGKTLPLFPCIDLGGFKDS